MELFYHHEGSPYVRKVLLVVNELDLRLNEHQVDMASREVMDRYGKINPNRKFPALRDGDLNLWESNAILLYLAHKVPDAGLHGKSTEESALVNQWLFWELAHFAGTVNFLVNHRLGFLPKPARAESDLAAETRKLFQILDDQLRQGQFLTGSKPRLPDFAVAADLTYAKEAGLPLNQFANVAAWMERISRRTSWQITEERKNRALAAFGVELQSVKSVTKS